MYKIEKEFHFSSAHHLSGIPEEHPCSRPHGHNYIAVFEFQAKTLNKVGFIIDYRDLEGIKKWIDNTLDHRDLNTILLFNPTAECIAQYLYEMFILIYPQLHAVRIKETEKTEARYEPDPS